MLVIVGTVIVIIAVVGGYAIPGGHLDVLWQPVEFMIILWGAVGMMLGALSIFLAQAIINLPF